jgi:hypothetical protein
MSIAELYNCGDFGNIFQRLITPSIRCWAKRSLLIPGLHGWHDRQELSCTSTLHLNWDSMGMPGKAGKIITGIIRAEVVKEQEWVQIGNLIVSESTLKTDAGSLDSGFTFPCFIYLPRHVFSLQKM